MNRIDRFRALHAEGTFVMPNPYDLGSARLLAALGYPALASTSCWPTSSRWPLRPSSR